MARRNLTPKQEKFATFYVELGNASEAYRRAYPGSRKWKVDAIHCAGSKMLAIGKVSERVEEIRAAGAKRAEITLDSLVSELEEARVAAMTIDPSRSAAVSATMGKAKLLGFVVDKHKVQGDVTMQQLPPLSPSAAKALLAKLESEKF